jgi:hypothetical protein
MRLSAPRPVESVTPASASREAVTPHLRPTVVSSVLDARFTPTAAAACAANSSATRCGTAARALRAVSA